MKIEIFEKSVTVDGVRYDRVADQDKEMCGRLEIAEMLGYRHKDGRPNQSNLWKNNKNAIFQFPNFEIEKAEGGAKPWTRAEVRAWLSIPMWKRREMYKETQDEINEFD